MDLQTNPARIVALIALVVLAGTQGWLDAADAEPGRVIDLRGQWDDRTPLENPHKGWYHHYPDNHIDKYVVTKDADLLAFPGMDHVYIRLAWAYLEPREGEFDWGVIDRIIDKWTKHGLGIAFRISCRETSTDRIEQQYATPRWVMQAGAKGGYYHMGMPTGPEGPWEPDFGDQVFMAKLENFLRAFAARYDGKPWLRYVDIGSIGDWGEGHTSAGSRMDCGLATRLRHVDLHLSFFKKSQLVATDDFVYVLKDPADRKTLHEHIITNGISYRDDSILVNGYLREHSDAFTVRSPEMFADAWLKTPTVFELEHYGAVKNLGNWDGRLDSQVTQFGKGKKGPDYFRGALELLHATYIGYHGDAHQWLADNPELTGELLNRCGYWYFPLTIRLPEQLAAGQEAEMEMAWENRGVAPAYEKFHLTVRLEGPGGFEQELESGNRRWIPRAAQTWNESYRLKLPADLKAGDYMLSFKLHSKAAGRDVLVGLDSMLLNARKFYQVGKVTVRP
jgi:hypothetical protein